MTNLRLILQPSVPSNPYLGTPSIPALFVQFKDGLASIEDEILIEKMMAHKGKGRDFIIVEEGETDPYLHQRAPSEPAHILSEIKNGRVVGRKKENLKKVLPPAIEKMINERATEIAKAMVPEILKSLKDEAAENAEVTEEVKVEATLPEVEKVEEPKPKPKPKKNK